MNRSFPLALAAALILGLAFGGACSDGGDGPSDNQGGAGGSDVVPEVCDNGIDEGGDGITDCEDPTCATHEYCVDCPDCGKACVRQVSNESESRACIGTTRGRIEAICSADGTCLKSGPVGDDGKVRRGSMLTKSRTANLSQSYAAQEVLVLHVDRPSSAEPLTCNDIMLNAVDPMDDTQVNVVHRSIAPIAQPGDEVPGPAFDIPLNEESKGHLFVVRFYAATPDMVAGQPRGAVVDDGCKEGVIVPEGEYVEDEAHEVRVDIEPICEGRLNRQCDEPKTCLLGLCRDQRCEPPCQSGRTCREWNDEPQCLVRCNPDAPQCAHLERCDATAGEIPVCVPAG